MRISDWSSDVCSSDLIGIAREAHRPFAQFRSFKTAEAARRREADRIVDDIVDGALEAVTVAHHRRRAPTWAGEGDARTGSALFGARGARCEHRFDHQSDVDRLEMGPRKMRVDAARVADIGAEQVGTTDALARDDEKLRAMLLALHPLQPLDGRPQRGDRKSTRLNS